MTNSILPSLIHDARRQIRRHGFQLTAPIRVERAWFERRFGRSAARFHGEYDPNTHTIYLNAASPWRTLSRPRFGKPRQFSSNHPAHIILHEIGHAMHFSQANGLARKLQRTDFRPDWIRKYGPRIRRLVSSYAATGPLEFVAEVFAGRVCGRQFPRDMMKIYTSLHGPKVPKK